MKYLPLILIIFGCSFEFEDEKIIDPLLQEHYETFIYEAGIRGVDLPNKAVMIYVDETYQGRAVCNTTRRSATIRVSKFWFENSPRYRIEATIFHELGHGLLERGHLEMYDGAPRSLMRVPSMRDDYQENRTEYINELFNKKLR